MISKCTCQQETVPRWTIRLPPERCHVSRSCEASFAFFPLAFLERLVEGIRIVDELQRVEEARQSWIIGQTARLQTRRATRVPSERASTRVTFLLVREPDPARPTAAPGDLGRLRMRRLDRALAPL